MNSVETVVKALAPVILEEVMPPYAILGHSTGGLCSFEVIREIRRLGGPEPVHLFVSGRRAPQLPMQPTPLASLSLDELSAFLRRMSGTPEEILRNHDMLGLIKPLLVADFAVNELYTYVSELPLTIPITTFAATRDPYADIIESAAWSEQTSAGFSMHTLNGGHFAIFEHATYVHNLVSATLRSWSHAARQAAI
jgi:surfactin synthase thioesterase subunit